MTGQAVKLTAGIGFVSGGAPEFTPGRETKVTARVILKTDVLDAARVGVARRIGRLARADNNVAPDVGTGRVTRKGGVSFAHAVTKDAVTVTGAIRDVVGVDEAGRGFAVERHDVTALEVRVVTQRDIGVVRHGEESISDSGEQVVRDFYAIRALRSIGRVFA